MKKKIFLRRLLVSANDKDSKKLRYCLVNQDDKNIEVCEHLVLNHF